MNYNFHRSQNEVFCIGQKICLSNISYLHKATGCHGLLVTHGKAYVCGRLSRDFSLVFYDPMTVNYFLYKSSNEIQSFV